MTDQQARTVLITGSARGLGLAMAKRFAGSGWNVVMLDRDEAALSAVEHPDLADGTRVLRLVADLTDEADIARAIESAEQAFGAIDVLINNAGLAPVKPFLSTDAADLRE